MLTVAIFYAALLAIPVIAVCNRPVDSQLRLTSGPDTGRPKTRGTHTTTAPDTGMPLARAAYVLAAIAVLLVVDAELFDRIRLAAGDLLSCMPGEERVSICAPSPRSIPDRAVHWRGLVVAGGVAAVSLIIRRHAIFPAVLGLALWVVVALVADLAFGREGAESEALVIPRVICSALLVIATVAGLALTGSLDPRHLAIAGGLYAYGLVFRLTAFQIAAWLWPHLFAASQAALLAFALVFPVFALAVMCLVGPIASRGRLTAPKASARADSVANTARSETHPLTAAQPVLCQRSTPDSIARKETA